MKQLHQLGTDVAGSLESARRTSGGAARVRAKLALGEARAARPSHLRRAPILGAIALAATLVLAISFASWRGRAITFKVAESERGVVGAFLAAPPAAPMPLAFSDGTTLRLLPSSRARVAEVTSRGARVLLESGVMHADVAHLPDAHWAVDAGPFEVRVTGTRFDVSWDPSTESVIVTLEEGSVVVTGCALGGEGRVVHAGERLSASCKDSSGGLTKTAAANAAPTPTIPGVTPASLPDAPAEAIAAAPTTNAPSPTLESRVGSVNTPPTDKAEDEIITLAKRGAHAEAVNAAEARGFGATCDALTAGELLLLADSSRYAGRFDRATEALTAVRRRFPRTDAAAAASFELGRIAFDVRKDYANAGDSFDTYLRERPSGGLAREALGRALEARFKAGDSTRAEQLGVRYLAAYPEGPHAKLARKVTTEGTP